jgi:DNA-directed RNA polymerase subunit N (RpoN/RPB10)
MENTTRIRRSVKLTKKQHSDFIKWVKNQDTKSDAAEKLGTTRQCLHRILLAGSGSQDSILKIIETIEA